MVPLNLVSNFYLSLFNRYLRLQLFIQRFDRDNEVYCILCCCTLCVSMINIVTDDMTNALHSTVCICCNTLEEYNRMKVGIVYHN
jgi:hypothetical protein